MVNRLEEVVIPLAGSGVKLRPHGKYQPGEYEILDNLDITPEGTLVNRRGFSFATQYDPTGALPPDTDYYQDAHRFIGTYGPDPVICTQSNFLYLVHSTGTTAPGLEGSPTTQVHRLDDLFNPLTIKAAVETALDALVGVPAGFLANERYSIEGFWNYLDFNYFLVEFVDAHSLGTLRRCLAVVKIHNTYDLTKSPTTQFVMDASDDGSPTTVSFIYAETLPFGAPGAFFVGLIPTSRHTVNSFLLHDERYWVATSDTVYFSAPADPSSWAAPDGGFIKFPKDEIKQIYALGDIIYVFCDSKIYAITYNTDFNTDGEVIIISPEVGGESACSVGDTIYSLKGNALYAISGNNISKVLSLDINLNFDEVIKRPVVGVNNAGKTPSFKVSSFDNELYIFMYYTRTEWVTSTVTSSFPLQTYRSELISSSLGNTDLYKINLEIGSISRVNIGPSLLATLSVGTAGVYPIDSIFVSTEDTENYARLFFLFRTDAGSASGWTVAYPDLNDFSTEFAGYDFVISPESPFPFSEYLAITPKYYARIRDFTPDGSKYFVKRFRSLLMEANLPEITVELPLPAITRWYADLNIYFNNIDTPSVTKNLVENDTGRADSSIGYRFPLNQRAKTMTIDLSMEAINQGTWYLSDMLAYNPTKVRLFEVSDLRVLWTPTNRSITSNQSPNI